MSTHFHTRLLGSLALFLATSTAVSESFGTFTAVSKGHHSCDRPDGMDDINQLTDTIIGLAIEIHRHLGPGLSEAAYERALCIDLAAARIPFHRQVRLPVTYKGEIVAEYRPDLLVDTRVVVEIKSIERLAPVHRAQMLTYLRVTGCEVGLLMNFNEEVLRSGIRRVVLQRGERTL